MEFPDLFVWIKQNVLKNYIEIIEAPVNDHRAVGLLERLMPANSTERTSCSAQIGHENTRQASLKENLR